MVISLKISAKELDNKVNYHKPIEFYKLNNKESDDANKVLFMAENLYMEVMEETSDQKRTKKVKQLKKMFQKFIFLLGTSAVLLPKRSMAAEVKNSWNQEEMLSSGSQITLTPDTIMDWGLTVALITVAIGVAVSMTLLTAAGIYRMFRKKKESEEWSTDVLKGLAQTLISIPTVYLLYYLAHIVFKNLPVLHGLF